MSTDFSLLSSRATRITEAPNCASSSALAFPMPCVLPQTTAFLFNRLISIVSSCWLCSPTARPHVPKRHREHAGPIHEFTRPTPRDRQVPRLKCEVNINAVNNNRDRFDNQIHNGVAGASNCVEPYRRKRH